MVSPDFFLSSAGEYRPLSQPRACWTKARLRDPVRDDYMLVEIEPVLLGQPFGLGGKDISRLILSTRHQGYTLYPVTEWPSHVYVARILDETVLQTLSFTKVQVELIAWALIFRTVEEAEAHAKKLDSHVVV
jgi:hypothetical protein